jgi:DNA-binding NarL/FixJ family response regulator
MKRIVKLVARGRSTRQLSAALFISEHTVQNHLRSVFEKVGVRCSSVTPSSLPTAEPMSSQKGQPICEEALSIARALRRPSIRLLTRSAVS